MAQSWNPGLLVSEDVNNSEPPFIWSLLGLCETYYVLGYWEDASTCWMAFQDQWARAWDRQWARKAFNSMVVMSSAYAPADTGHSRNYRFRTFCINLLTVPDISGTLCFLPKWLCEKEISKTKNFSHLRITSEPKDNGKKTPPQTRWNKVNIVGSQLWDLIACMIILTHST